MTEIRVEDENPIQELEALLATLGTTEGQLKTLKAAADRKIQALLAEYAHEIDHLTELRDTTIKEITDIYEENRDIFNTDKGKTVVLRGGTLSARFGNESLKIVDEAKLEKFLRRNGRWLKYTIQPKRKIDKRALKRDRALVENAPDSVMYFSREEHLIIKLPSLQLEIKRILQPFRGLLNKS